MADENKMKLTLILGSGFSKAARLPNTNEIVNDFLTSPVGFESYELEEKIIEILKQFWRDVFGYNGGNSKPTLEDHFTVLDLAANSGHQLGPNYTPKKLRAIRRMSIHRIFKILDRRYRKSEHIIRLLHKLKDYFE